MNSDVLVPFLAAIVGGALRVGVPFLFVSLGECLTEKSGRINLGLEGVLVLSAMAGFGGAYLAGSPWAGVRARRRRWRVARAAARRALLAAARQRRRHRHRPHAARHRPRLLPRQAADPAAGAAAAADRARRLEQLTGGPGRAAGSIRCCRSASPLAVAMRWGFARTRWGLLVRLAGDSASATQGARLLGQRHPHRRHGRRRRDRRPRRRLADAVLSGQLERGHLERPGPDRRRARHLRALEPVALRRRGAALRRRRRDRPGAAVGRREPGLLPVRRGALRAHPGDPGDQLPARQRRQGQPGRASR